MSVEDDEYPGLRSTNKMLKKIENSSMMTIAEQSMSSQTPMG
jgi:hypothetical protein